MKMSFTKNHIFSASALESEAARKTLRQILQKRTFSLEQSVEKKKNYSIMEKSKSPTNM